MKVRWFEDNSGNISAMRILVVPTVYVGIMINIAATISFFLKYTDSTLLAGIGTGMITVALATKAWQKGSEGSCNAN